MLARDLIHRLSDHPFKPLRIHLSDGATMDVVQPFLVSVGATSAVLPAELGQDPEGYPVATRWQTIALLHMVRFSELGNGRSTRRRRGAG